jgi:hypothetical protein
MDAGKRSLLFLLPKVTFHLEDENLFGTTPSGLIVIFQIP